MSLEFVSPLPISHYQLRAVQVMVPVIIHVLNIAPIGIEMQADHDAIFRIEPITQSGRDLLGIVVVLEVKQRVLFVVLRIVIADERRRAIVKLFQQPRAVIDAVDGRFIRTLLRDRVARAERPNPIAVNDRIAREPDFIFLVCTLDGIAAPMTDLVTEAVTRRQMIEMPSVMQNQRRLFLYPNIIAVTVKAVDDSRACITIAVTNLGIAPNAMFRLEMQLCHVLEMIRNRNKQRNFPFGGGKFLLCAKEGGKMPE